MKLGLENRELRSVLTDRTVRMEYSDAYFVGIESPFTVELQGRIVSLSPEDDEEAFKPLREMICQTVADAVAAKSGSLTVLFANGVRITVEPDPAYEAWNVSGPDGMLVVSTPGGKLATWRAP
jgi:hypothetical protein